MKVLQIPIEKLNMAQYNPRKALQSGDIEYEKLKGSIQEFGYVDPIIWNQQTGNVVGGHQRLTVLKDLGYSEIACVVLDIDETREKALNIALNKINGEWDIPALRELLIDLSDSSISLELTGFDQKEIYDILQQFEESIGEIKEDDFSLEDAVNEIREPQSKPGYIWLLGPHRLMCGDATNPDHVAMLMNGHFADMVFTDPPYNVDYTGKTKEALKIQNDKMAHDKFKSFLLASYTNLFSITKEGGAIYVCHADSEGVNFRTAMLEVGWLLKQTIIWVKNAFVMGRQDYHWRHEPILYGWKPGASHQWYGDRKQDTVWEINKPNANKEHPTIKPLDLIAKAINNSSKGRDIVVDLFGGSGSTLITADQQNRICFTMEIDPVYCDVVKNRWERMTGDIAVLQNE